MNNNYIYRCYKRLKEINAPLENWKCIGVVDFGSSDFTCELCGCTKVRYVHEMYNAAYPSVLSVGCICAGVMEGNIAAAKERELEARKRSKRKSNYLKKQWTSVNSTTWQLKYKRQNLEIQQDSFRNVPYFKIFINSEGYQWKNNRRIKTFLEAQHYTFDLLESDWL